SFAATADSHDSLLSFHDLRECVVGDVASASAPRFGIKFLCLWCASWLSRLRRNRRRLVVAENQRADRHKQISGGRHCLICFCHHRPRLCPFFFLSCSRVSNWR